MICACEKCNSNGMDKGKGRRSGKGKGKGRGRGKRELKQRQLKRAERAAAGLRHAHEGSGRPLSQLYGTR